MRRTASSRYVCIKQGKRVRHVVQRILLALLVANLILPSFASIHASAEDGGILAPGFYKDRIVLCTGAGLKIIKLDPTTGKPLKDQPDTGDQVSPMCSPMVTASLFFSPVQIVSDAVFGTGEPYASIVETRPAYDRVAAPPLPPRGPPVV